MDKIDNVGTMSTRLNKPDEDDPSASHILDLEVPFTTLGTLWTQVAQCILKMVRLRFPRIGSLLETSTQVYEVAARPITHNMTDMVRLANIPRCLLPEQDKTYTSADAWYTALAEMHIAQLVFQRNDAVVSETDCRNKFVSRQIFRRLAKEGKLFKFGFAEDTWSAQSLEMPPSTLCPAPSGTDDFRIWGDDFRAGNILLDSSDNITALIDWEFTYVGPTQFNLDPPWWLLIETAEMWPGGLESWIEAYSARLPTWLQSMKTAETRDPLPVFLEAPLSRYMEESWTTGRFFLNYAARKSWAFDTMYWNFLDERFFGKRDECLGDDLWKARVHLMTEEEKGALEPFVSMKMSEVEDRRIVDWGEAEAKSRLAEVLFA